MKKFYFEIFAITLAVLVPTAIVVWYLRNAEGFWAAQTIWSAVLAMGWAVVAGGYFHQGWLVRQSADASDVSLVLPLAVFVVQCVLFVKGVYYSDWSLIWGALVVNSGVCFNLYHIVQARRDKRA